MKTTNLIQLLKRQGLILAMINVGPEREGQPSNNPEVGEPNDLDRDERDDYDITEEPLIGGEDDIDREPLSDDDVDVSGLPGEEPLQDDIDRVNVVEEQIREDRQEDEIGTPYDVDNEDDTISNLDDDVLGER
ncbi:hypothetical protein [Sphingobacterium pedocola]|uniref:DNA primase n=1 Tax=Sphingobacterium pedocola TaxID=2082722 RepID=A0ABR9TCH2_9SPHI|nr:hypothetical protein [Sphingobacterium pedocola]MBE8723048.1 hypothetical protein [Sphingobacterium pedocola]